MVQLAVDSFNPCCAGCSSGRDENVEFETTNGCFNPCCAGCSSGSCRKVLDLQAPN